MNRQQRRSLARKVQKSSQKRDVDVVDEDGVEVNKIGDKVELKVYAGGMTAYAVRWRKEDAMHIAGMIIEAAEGEVKEKEIVRGSGLVVARGMPT